MSQHLTPERALIFRITHVDNVPWLLQNGLRSAGSAKQDPGFVAIGRRELIEARARRRVQEGPQGTLKDYIPFYFTPFSPMLMNIKTGYMPSVIQRPNEQIAILVSSLHKVEEAGRPCLISDRNALYATARLTADLSKLGDWVPWDLIQARDFKRDPERPDKVERYMAEALVHDYLPSSALLGIVCYSEARAEPLCCDVQAAGLSASVEVKPGWYF